MTLPGYLAVALAGGLGMYFGIGGLYEWLYYRRRRADAAAWKCQPKRFATPSFRRREILLGTANLSAGSLLSGFLAHDVATANHTAITFGGSIAAGLALTVAYFLITDGALYWAHRIFHRPALFRLVHRFHHRNTTPTAFTSTAMHPIEFFTYQGIMLAPLFVLPLPVWGVVFVLVYQNLVALVDHSGVDARSLIPWQPPARFHDDHHVYFHVNYGQTLGVWDRIFGTWRREGRVYGEHVFGGRGKPAPGSAQVHDAPPRYVRYGDRA